MGWANGVEAAEDVWELVKQFIPNKNEKIYLAQALIRVFEAHGCDNMNEAESLRKDADEKLEKQRRRNDFSYSRDFESSSRLRGKS